MKKFVCNLLDSSKCIRTGYEETVEATTRKEAIHEYFCYIRDNEDENVTKNDIECTEIDWE